LFTFKSPVLIVIQLLPIFHGNSFMKILIAPRPAKHVSEQLINKPTCAVNNLLIYFYSSLNQYKMNMNTGPTFGNMVPPQQQAGGGAPQQVQQQMQQPVNNNPVQPNNNTAPAFPTPPEGAQQFCLRWNSYPATVATQLAALRAQEDFVDVTLACDGRQLRAHKLVLSACSPYFMQLFKVKVK
jgi:hypothetical protein